MWNVNEGLAFGREKEMDMIDPDLRMNEENPVYVILPLD